RPTTSEAAPQPRSALCGRCSTPRRTVSPHTATTTSVRSSTRTPASDSQTQRSPKGERHGAPLCSLAKASLDAPQRVGRASEEVAWRAAAQEAARAPGAALICGRSGEWYRDAETPKPADLLVVGLRPSDDLTRTPSPSSGVTGRSWRSG